MPEKIKWDQDGKRFYETGVDHGILFTKTGLNGAYAKGVAWNGLTTISDKPTGAEATAIYADNIKYLNLISVEECEGTIEAYTYPDEFMVCDGSVEAEDGVYVTAQTRAQFGLYYRTKIGNDITGDLGYKHHFIYGATATPSEKSYNTVNDSPEAATMSWDFKTVPVEIEGKKPSAHIIIDSRKADADKLKELLALVEGTDADPEEEIVGNDPTFPTPAQIFSIMHVQQ